MGKLGPSCEVKWKSLSCVRLFATPWANSPWNSPGQNTRVGSCSLLQGIFPSQGLNPGLLHCRKILYHLSHQVSPIPSHIFQLFQNFLHSTNPSKPSSPNFLLSLISDTEIVSHTLQATCENCNSVSSLRNSSFMGAKNQKNHQLRRRSQNE